MKPIPKDSNDNRLQGAASEFMVVELPGVAATGDGATVLVPEMKSISMWATNGTSSFTVSNLGTSGFTTQVDGATVTGLITDQVYLIDNAAATDEGV
jgi:hypothetical protein